MEPVTLNRQRSMYATKFDVDTTINAIKLPGLLKSEYLTQFETVPCALILHGAQLSNGKGALQTCQVRTDSRRNDLFTQRNSQKLAKIPPTPGDFSR